MEKKYAYVTLLSSDSYFFGVLGLNRSLQEAKSKYPLHVIVTDNVNERIVQGLKEHNIKYTIFHYYEWQNDFILEAYKSTINKFYLFLLEEYDAVCFLDADMLILSAEYFDDNFDNFMLLKSNLLGYDRWWGRGKGTPPLISGAIFYAKPNEFIANWIFTKGFYFDCDETPLTILFLDTVSFLPPEDFISFEYYYHADREKFLKALKNKEIKAIHSSGGKYWISDDIKNIDDFKKKLDEFFPS